MERSSPPAFASSWPAEFDGPRESSSAPAFVSSCPVKLERLRERSTSSSCLVFFAFSFWFGLAVFSFGSNVRVSILLAISFNGHVRSLVTTKGLRLGENPVTKFATVGPWWGIRLGRRDDGKEESCSKCEVFEVRREGKKCLRHEYEVRHTL